MTHHPPLSFGEVFQIQKILGPAGCFFIFPEVVQTKKRNLYTINLMYDPVLKTLIENNTRNPCKDFYSGWLHAHPDHLVGASVINCEFGQGGPINPLRFAELSRVFPSRLMRQEK